MPGARLGGALVAQALVVATGGPLLAPHDPMLQQRDGLTDMGLPLPPGEQPRFLLGTDGLGRDVLSRLVHGARISMLVGGLANGLAMLIGRFLMIIPMMGIAGSLAAKKIVPPSAGTFPVHTPLFVTLLIGVVLIVGALTFFPLLSLGPIVEHFLMNAGTTF